ncbi:hypothetical protein GR7B_00198 [Vibrio phage vB_VcorM_GR7B]|nr:hypothetical protein GR7B_00198 [Vibrio phage vB_VcorM_GR7B]
MIAEIKHIKDMSSEPDVLVMAASGWRELVKSSGISAETRYTFYGNIDCLVAYDEEGLPIGLISYFSNGEGKWWVSFSYVVPSFRGNGVWKELWHKLVAHAQQSSIKYLDGGTHMDNVAMQKAAESVGRVAETITYTFKVPDVIPTIDGD